MKQFALMMALVSLFMMTQSVFAAEIETLLMPGEVIDDHAEYETECSKCHVRFSKKTQTRLCLDCHEEVDRDIAEATGFHGRHGSIRDQECKQCHSEHLGRSADIVQLNHATFDHSETDFLLEGKHTRISCASCHEPDKAYSEAGSVCFDCHSEQDPHDGERGEQCQDCHSPKHWTDIRFDHDTTDFPLHGKHRDAACKSCHLGSTYDDTPEECNSCHYLDDTHNGRNGTECGDCHNPDKWDKTDFDHQRDTDFALKGRHRDIRCDACHTEALGKSSPETDCYSCHRNDDQHRGRYGRECDSCHGETSWAKTRFDHARETDFALTGQHADLLCAACHQGALGKEELTTSCNGCHSGDDVHEGQQGEQCERCHRDSGWGDEVVFVHDLTHFPLLGLHASTPCEECHMSPAFKDTDKECIECHRDDDTHKAALGADCNQCHNPNGWGVWQFDHDQQTEFKLDGAHRELSCENCHNKPVKSKIRMSTRCQTCHESDDVHRGGFGRNCDRCHNTERFSDVAIQ